MIVRMLGWFVGIFAAIAATSAYSACSSFVDRVVINEMRYHNSAYFIELKALDTTIAADTNNFDGWKLTLYYKQGQVKQLTKNVSEMYLSGSDSCGTGNLVYMTWDPGTNPPLDDSVIVVTDKAGNEVDVLYVGQNEYPDYYASSCSYPASHDTKVPLTGSSGHKDLARLPDGTGNWLISPGTGSGSTNTQCTTNDAILGVTKTVQSSGAPSASLTVATGTTVAYKVTASNTAGGTLSDLIIKEPLPSWLGSPTVAVTAGSYNALSGEWSIAWLGSAASATLTISGVANVTGTHTNTAVATRINTGEGAVTGTFQSASAVLIVQSAASDFRVYDSTCATARCVRTHVAGGSGLCTASGDCTMTVAALDASSGASSHTGNLSATLEYCTNVTRTAAGGISCGGGWGVVPGTSAQTVAFSGATTSPLTFPPVANVYEIVRVKLVPTSGSGGPWYSDSFAIRPSALSVSASDADWLSAGSSRSLTSGSNIHKAGRPFSLTAMAGFSNYPGTLLSVGNLGPAVSALTPTPDCSALTPADPACTLSAGTWEDVAGGVTSATANYGEVGSVMLTLQDQHFADIDAADSSTAERYFSGTVTVQRFVPDQFKTEVIYKSVCDFAYSGQPFELNVTARNAAGQTTRNYDNANSLSRTLTLADGGGSTVGSFNLPTLDKSLFVQGVARELAQKYSFTDVKTVPTAIRVRVSEPAGADDVKSSDPGGEEGLLAVRSGRLWLANAYGSELLPLPVPMQTQYWSATGWALNTADSCTSLMVPTVANIGLTNTLANKTTASLSAPVVAGQVAFRLSAPGQNNTGVVDVVGSVVRGANTWLQLSTPRVRACFGVCGPRSPVIYQRERY